MTGKRWKIIDEEFISYTGGTAQLISNGECEVHLWERPNDAQLFCDELNELHEENKLLLRRNGAMEEEIECLSEEIKDLNDVLARYEEKELKE